MLKFLNLFFRDLCRVFARSVIYVLIAVLVSFAVGYIWSPKFVEYMGAERIYYVNAVRYASVGVWAMFFMFAAMMVVVVACQWFGEDMLTNRSYLNHMLPVYTWELVISKALAGIIVMLMAIAIMALNMISVAENISVINDLLGIIPDLAKSDGLNFDLEMFIKLGIYFIMMQCLFIMSAAFISLSIGQLFSKGAGRTMLILLGFFAVIFISLFVLANAFRTAGIALDLSAIKSVQSIFDMAEAILRCVSNTNLVLSVIFLAGTSLILTYKLNV